jgi:hypothetical protein
MYIRVLIGRDGLVLRLSTRWRFGAIVSYFRKISESLRCASVESDVIAFIQSHSLTLYNLPISICKDNVFYIALDYMLQNITQYLPKCSPRVRTRSNSKRLNTDDRATKSATHHVQS